MEKTVAETKVCSRSDCKQAGKPQPIDNFYIKNGRPYSWCKECTKAVQAAFDAKRKKEKEKPSTNQLADEVEKLLEKRNSENGASMEGVEAILPKQPSSMLPAPGPDRFLPDKLVIDLSDYPEVRDLLTAEAKEQIRTIEGQAMYILRESLAKI